MDKRLKDLIRVNKVMVFSKDYCPFSDKAKGLLNQRNIKFKVVEMDLLPDGKAMHKALKTFSGQNSIPVIYINGRKLGTYDDMRLAATNGRLDNLLQDPGNL